MRIYLRFFEDDMVKYGTLCFFPLEIHFPEITRKNVRNPGYPTWFLNGLRSGKLAFFLMGKYRYPLVMVN